MSAVANGINHVSRRLDHDHKSSSVPSGAHITPGTGHKATDTGKSIVFGTREDVDDVFHEVLTSSGHFAEDLAMDPAGELHLSSSGYLEHHLPATSFKLPDHEGGGHYDINFSLFGEGAHHLAPEPIFTASADFAAPGHLPGERRLYDKVAVAFNDDKHTFAITDTMSFTELVKEAVHYWGLSSGALKFELHDDQGEPYAVSAQVQKTLAAQPPRTPHWIPVLVLGEKKKKKRKMKETDPTKKTTKKTKKPKEKDTAATAAALKAGDAGPAQPADATKPAPAGVPKGVLTAKAVAKAQPKGADMKAMAIRSPQKVLSTSSGAIGAPNGIRTTIKPGDLSVSTPMEGVTETTNAATVSAPKPTALVKQPQIMYANGTALTTLYKAPAAGIVQTQTIATQPLTLTPLQQQHAAAARAAQVHQANLRQQKPAAPTNTLGQQPPLADASKAAKPAAPGTVPYPYPSQGQAQAQAVRQTSVATAHAVYTVQQGRMATPMVGVSGQATVVSTTAPMVAAVRMASKPAAPPAMMQRIPTGIALPPGAVGQTSGTTSLASNATPSAPKQLMPTTIPTGPQGTPAKPPAQPMAQSGAKPQAVATTSLPSYQMQQVLASAAAPEGSTSTVYTTVPLTKPATAAPKSVVQAPLGLMVNTSPITNISASLNSISNSSSVIPSPSAANSHAIIALQAALPHRNPSTVAALSTSPALQAARLPPPSTPPKDVSSANASAHAAVALSAQLAASAAGRLPAGTASASLLPPSGASVLPTAAHVGPSSQPPNTSPPQAGQQ